MELEKMRLYKEESLRDWQMEEFLTALERLNRVHETIGGMERNATSYSNGESTKTKLIPMKDKTPNIPTGSLNINMEQNVRSKTMRACVFATRIILVTSGRRWELSNCGIQRWSLLQMPQELGTWPGTAIERRRVSIVERKGITQLFASEEKNQWIRRGNSPILERQPCWAWRRGNSNGERARSVSGHSYFNWCSNGGNACTTCVKWWPHCNGHVSSPGP